MGNKWELADEDTNFVQYILYHTESEISEINEENIIATFNNINIDNYIISIENFDPIEENWFWIGIQDVYGAISIGNAISKLILLTYLELYLGISKLD